MKLTVTAAVFEYGLKNTKDTVCKDESRPVLKHIHLIVKDDLITFESLNGYCLSRVCMPHGSEDFDGKNFEILFTPFTLPKKARFVSIDLTDDGTIIFAVIGEKVTSITQENMKDPFVNVAQIIPVYSAPFEIAFNAALMTDCLKSFVGQSEYNRVVMQVDPYSKSNPFLLKLNSGAGNDEFVKVMLPLRL